MKKNILVEANKNIDQIHNLGLYSNMVSVEGVGDVIVGIHNVFKKKILGIGTMFSNFIALSPDAKNTNPYILDLKKRYRLIDPILREVEYSNVSRIEVHTVVGLNNNLVKTLEIMTSSLSGITDKLTVSLDNLDTYVSNILGNEDFRHSSRPQKPDEELAKMQKDLYDVLGKLITTKRLDDTDTIGNLIPNISSIKICYDTLINLGESNSLKYLNSVYDNIKHVDNKIQTLIDMITTNPDFKVNKAMIVKLSTDLENGAKLVTVVVSILHLYNQLAHVLAKLIDRLKI